MHNLRGDRIARLHEAFLDAAARWPDLSMVAVSPRPEDLGDWPKLPTVDGYSLGIGSGAWRPLLRKPAGAMFAPLSDCWLRIQGDLWHGALFSTSNADVNPMLIDNVREHTALVQRTHDLREGRDELVRLARLAVNEFPMVAPPSIAPNLPRHASAEYRWLEAVCYLAAQFDDVEGAFIVQRLPTDVFTASARTVDILAMLPAGPNRLIGIANKAEANVSTMQHGYLVDEIMLGPTMASGNRFPISNFDCKAVAGVVPSICPNADRKPAEQWLPDIEVRFREMGLVKTGETIHWVGSQSTPETVCGCSFVASEEKSLTRSTVSATGTRK